METQTHTYNRFCWFCFPKPAKQSYFSCSRSTRRRAPYIHYKNMGFVDLVKSVLPCGLPKLHSPSGPPCSDIHRPPQGIAHPLHNALHAGLREAPRIVGRHMGPGVDSRREFRLSVGGGSSSFRPPRMGRPRRAAPSRPGRGHTRARRPPGKRQPFAHTCRT